MRLVSLVILSLIYIWGLNKLCLKYEAFIVINWKETDLFWNFYDTLAYFNVRSDSRFRFFLQSRRLFIRCMYLRG